MSNKLPKDIEKLFLKMLLQRTINQSVQNDAQYLKDKEASGRGIGGTIRLFIRW